MSAYGNLPAYPVPANAPTEGVSRRDWFAAMALSGVITKGLEIMGDRVVSEQERTMMLARKAYAFADAMVQLSEEHTANATADAIQ